MRISKAFGSEYAFRPGWTLLQSLYIRIFGMVDLPTRIRARAVLSALKDIPCNTFLDFGAGTGVYSFFITRNPACKGIALDVDADRISSIRHQARLLGRTGLEALCANENSLSELPPSAFSIVLAIEVLTCIANPDRALADLRNRLCRGGVLIAHIPIRDDLRPYECNLFDDHEIHRLFVKAGFEPPEIRQTFGPVSMALSDLFSWAASMPKVLALVYPLFLLAAQMSPRFVHNGAYRLIVARRAQDGPP